MRGRTVTVTDGRARRWRGRARRCGKRRSGIRWRIGAVLAVGAITVGALVGCGAGDDGGETTATGAPTPAASESAPPPEAGIADRAGDPPASVSGVPVTIEGDGSILLGAADAPIVLDTYEDYLCEACGRLTGLDGRAVYAAISDHRLAERYHTITLLDGKSPSGDYSTRAAAAARCVAGTGDATAFSEFRDMLFSEGVQPKQGGSTDHDDAGLAQIARQAGAAPEAIDCIAHGEQVDEAAAAAEAARTSLAAVSGGRTITPSVYRGTAEVKIGRSEWLTDLLASSAPTSPTTAPTAGGGP